MSLPPENDPRWQATLEYSTADDGIWLIYTSPVSGPQRVNMGFWPTAEDVTLEVENLTP